MAISPKPQYILAIVALSLISPSLLLAQERYDDHKPAETFYLRVGSFEQNGQNSTIRVDSKKVGLGAIIDLEDNLDIDATVRVFRLDGYYRFNPRHRLDWSYYQTRRTGTSEIINEDLEIGDKVFEIGDTLRTEMDVGIVKLGWAYSFINVQKYEFFIGAGLNLRKTKLKFENRLSGNETEEVQEETFDSSSTVPLPTLNAGMRYSFTPKLSLNWRYEVLAMEFGEFKGRMQESYLLLEHSTFEHFGFGGGINSFNFDLEMDNSDFRGEVETDYLGFLLYAKTYF